MIDKKLEQEIKDVQEFTVIWNDFFQMFETGLMSEEWDEETDAKFLKLKAQIAFRKQVLLDSLGGDEFGMAKDIKKVIAMCPSFDLLRGESQIKISTIRSMWHEVFIALNKLIGQLKARQQSIASVSEFSHRMEKIKKSKGLKVGAWVVGIVVIAAILLAVVPFGDIFEKIRGAAGR